MGAGSFLAAAIESGAVPVVDLREVFRQAQGSAIVKAAHAVHAGAMPPLTRVAPRIPSQVRTLLHCRSCCPDTKVIGCSICPSSAARVCGHCASYQRP